MEFGIFSNGFRPHTTASRTYEEDLAEIVLADQLGFRDAYISEHHGEPIYIDTIDTLPVPELLMCKAAALTRRIRMGAAVKLIHLAHPVDTAIQAAVTDHVVGGGRFIFGFGSGIPQSSVRASARPLPRRPPCPPARIARSHPRGAGPRTSRSTGTANSGAARTSSPRRARCTAHADGDRHRHRGDDRSRRSPRLYSAVRPTRARAVHQEKGRSLCACRESCGLAARRSPTLPSRATSTSPTPGARRWTICGPSSPMSSAFR